MSQVQVHILTALDWASHMASRMPNRLPNSPVEAFAPHYGICPLMQAGSHPLTASAGSEDHWERIATNVVILAAINCDRKSAPGANVCDGCIELLCVPDTVSRKW